MTTINNVLENTGLHLIQRNVWIPERLERALKEWTPKSDLGRFIRLCSEDLAIFGKVDEAAELIERFSKIVILQSNLDIVAHVWNDIFGIRLNDNYGIVSDKVITTTGVGFLTDAWRNTVELETMKYHGIGTGGAAEATGNTALTTELTTEYVGDTRATGTLAGSGTTFVTVGTITLDSGTPAITEHGIFSAASAGVLWDRSLFSAINLVGANGDGITATYTMTASAGG